MSGVGAPRRSPGAVYFGMPIFIGPKLTLPRHPRSAAACARVRSARRPGAARPHPAPHAAPRGCRGSVSFGPMKIGIPKETAPGERRVALTPDMVARLVKAGHEVVVEVGAGSEAGFPDTGYTTAGASLGDAWSGAIVCKVQKP